MSAPSVGRSSEQLTSVTIATSVLECFVTDVELGPTQVARRLGIAKSTACRMLAALAASGVLERTPAGRYRLGLRLFQYGQLAVDRLPVRAVARPELLELHEALRETVQLGLPVGGQVLYVDRVAVTGFGARLNGEVMRRVPGYSSSAGRIMAAFDEQVAAQTLAVRRTKHTPFTIVDADRLASVLDGARRAGWVASREEFQLGMSSIAAPILAPGVRGAVSVVGPTPHLLGARKEAVAAAVCRAARRISQRLSAVDAR